MNGPCLRCGGANVAQGHHVLGRDASRAYVVPEVLAPLCAPRCHQAGIHRLLSTAGLDGPMKATPGVLVGRIACFLGWLVWPCEDDDCEPVVGGALRTVLAEIANVLAAIAHELRTDERGAR